MGSTLDDETWSWMMFLNFLMNALVGSTFLNIYEPLTAILSFSLTSAVLIKALMWPKSTNYNWRPSTMNIMSFFSGSIRRTKDPYIFLFLFLSLPILSLPTYTVTNRSLWIVYYCNPKTRKVSKEFKKPSFCQIILKRNDLKSYYLNNI